MLSRSGCIAYATQMVNFLSNVDKKVFVSSLSKEALPKGSHKVRTYRNAFEFIITSLLILPFLCIWVFILISKKKYTTAYFPIFHHWNIFLIILCKLMKVKVIFTVHDGILHDGEHSFSEQYLINQNILFADELIFLSNYVKEITEANVKFTASTHIIPHPLLTIGSENTKTRKLPAQPALLFLGRVVKYKGVDMLLEAMQKIPQNDYKKLTIAGVHHTSFVQKAQKDVVYYNKWLSEAEMRDLLESHDILVLPYLEASQSGLIALGIRAGIPMICTKVGGLTEQLTENEALFVNPTAEALQKGISDLLKNEKRYIEIHKNLKTKANKHDENIKKAIRDRFHATSKKHRTGRL